MSLLHLAATAGRIQRQYSARLGLASTWLVSRHAFATVDVSSPETHDDFKPKVKPEAAAGDASTVIQKDVSSSDVFIYMKGIPTAPQCGFSYQACRILDAYEVRYGSRNVLADQAIREGIKKFTSWPTIPQIFINGEFVGGSDILLNMHETGELAKLLEPIVDKQQKKQGKQ